MSATPKNILILGAKGMLGRDLVELTQEKYCSAITPDSTIHSWDIDELDITNYDQVQTALQKLCPQLVINCAAYTNVDNCETNHKAAFTVNADAPKYISKACQQLNAKFVHVSTDYVFNGQSEKPYLPDGPADPINEYGQSKWQGEQNIRSHCKNHIIVRTSWLFGPHGKNFVKTIRNLGQKKDHLNVVNDQIGCPTLTVDLADSIWRLISADAIGTFHFHNSGQCSWFEFASEIIRQYQLTCDVRPITSDQFPLPAARPKYSIMDLGSYVDATGHTPRSWQQALAEYVRLDPA